MDDLRFYVLFNSISVISGQRANDNGRLCAMEPRPNRVIVLEAIFHTSLPGESAERVVKSRKHPKLTLPVLVIATNPSADNVIWDR